MHSMMQYVPLEAKLIKASRTDIRQVVVCACVCPLTQKLCTYEVVVVHAIQPPGRPRPKWEISFGLWEQSCSIKHKTVRLTLNSDYI